MTHTLFKFLLAGGLTFVLLSCFSKQSSEKEAIGGSDVVAEPAEDDDDDDDYSDLWLPEEFKEEHYDEWVVVSRAYYIEQQDSQNIDFARIDKLVRGYISKKRIALPQDKYQRILKIEEICKSRFDISGYDDSNMGMIIAYSVSYTFDSYVMWLLSQEVNKVEDTGINLNEEAEILKQLMGAFYMCCDSIGYAFGGTGGWHGVTNITYMQDNLTRSMFKAILCPEAADDLPFRLTPKHFEDECKLRMANYTKDFEDATEPETVKRCLDKYATAVKTWLLYRQYVETQITNPALKSRYSYLTRTLAREQYIHLKNKFIGIGICSASLHTECCLQLDCTDEEMLSYNFEEAYQRYISK